MPSEPISGVRWERLRHGLYRHEFGGVVAELENVSEWKAPMWEIRVNGVVVGKAMYLVDAKVRGLSFLADEIHRRVYGFERGQRRKGA